MPQLAPNFKLTEIPKTDIPLSGYKPHWGETLDDIPASSPTLPDWLTSYTPEQHQTLANGQTLVKYPRTKEQIELEQQVFDIFFERFLDEIAEGELTTDIIKRDPRNIPAGRFLRWIMKDPTRASRFEEAKGIQTFYLEDKKNKIAEGTDNPMEDASRSKLRIDSLNDTMSAWNPKRYGNKKQLDINMSTTIDVRALMEQRDAQLYTLGNIYENESSQSTDPSQLPLLTVDDNQ